MSPGQKSAVCVFCASSDAIDQRYLDLAAQLGAALAAAGFDLVTGGGCVSMMGAVVTAARAGGARTTGVIPRALVAREVADTGSDELLVVDTLQERKAEMLSRASAFIALPGGIGTLDELLEVWTERVLGLHDKPVVICDPWDDFGYLRTLAAQWESGGFAPPGLLDHLVLTSDAAAACAAVAAG